MRIGSLFSGAGGLDMAVEEVFGGEVAWHCEVDPAASKVLAHRWPGVPNYGDITNVDWHSDHHQVEPVDIICGGWPCQPFSLAGKRKGAEDERALWPYVARAVRMVRPRYVVLENVSAVLGPEFQRVANDLAALGYDIGWTCQRASDVGAPHRRERLFVIATDTQRRDRQQPHGHADLGGWAHDTEQAWLGNSGDVDLLPTPTTQDGANCAGPSQFERNSRPLNVVATLLQTPSTADGEGSRKARGGERSNEPLLPGQAVEMATAWGKYGPAIERWEQVTRPAPPPTEPNTKGNPRLSPAFSEWLMGWPSGWVTQVPGISRNDQLRIVGNGVVPQCAAAALTWLLSIEQAA